MSICGSWHDWWWPWNMSILDFDIHGCIIKGLWVYQGWHFCVVEPQPPQDQSSKQVQVVMTNVTSYDVLIRGVVLYLMGFVFNFWEETISYKLGCQSRDGHQVQLPIQYFAQGVGSIGGVTMYMMAKFVTLLAKKSQSQPSR